LAVKLLDNLWVSNELALEKTFSKDKPPLEQIRDKLHRVYSQARASREKTGQINGCAMGVLASSLSSRSSRSSRSEKSENALLFFTTIRDNFISHLSSRLSRKVTFVQISMLLN